MSFGPDTGPPSTPGVPKDPLNVSPRAAQFDALVGQAEGGAAARSAATAMGICATHRKELKTGVVANMLKAQGLSYVPVTVDFNVGNSQTFGVAVQTATEKWSAGGTVTISSSAGAERTWSGTYLVQNKINYRRYWNDCTGQNTWRPESVNAILSGATLVGRTDYGYCTTLTSGKYWKDKGRNSTVSGGVKFPNISLSAQSGWSSGTRIAWVFNAKGRLCGSSNLGWASSAWAGARPPA